MALFGRKAKGRHALGAAVTSIPSGPLLGGGVAPVPAAAVVPAAPAPVAAPTAAVAPAHAFLPEVPAGPAPPVVAERPAPPAPAELSQPPSGAALMNEIAGLIASGEAWSTEPASAPPAQPPLVHTASIKPAVLAPIQAPLVQATLQPLPDQAPGEDRAFAPRMAPQPQALSASAPASSPTATTPARFSLETALAELLPLQHDSGGLPLPPAAVQASAGPLAAAPPVEAPGGSRVQLGFRDGSSAPLDPDSTQYSELAQLAQSLTRRD